MHWKMSSAKVAAILSGEDDHHTECDPSPGIHITAYSSTALFSLHIDAKTKWRIFCTFNFYMSLFQPYSYFSPNLTAFSNKGSSALDQVAWCQPEKQAHYLKQFTSVFIRSQTSITSKRNWDVMWRHQMETFSALLALCAGNSPVPVNSPHKGQWRGALMFALICAWINDWVNNREAGDLRRHRGHYDVNVIWSHLSASS